MAANQSLFSDISNQVNNYENKQPHEVSASYCYLAAAPWIDRIWPACSKGFTSLPHLCCFRDLSTKRNGFFQGGNNGSLKISWHSFRASEATKLSVGIQELTSCKYSVQKANKMHI